MHLLPDGNFNVQRLRKITEKRQSEEEIRKRYRLLIVFIICMWVKYYVQCCQPNGLSRTLTIPEELKQKVQNYMKVISICSVASRWH